MILPHGLAANEIRVLQEFRRTQQKTMTLEEIRSIKQPIKGDPVPPLIEKGFLVEAEAGVSVTLTGKAEEFLAYDPKPRA